MDSPGVIGRRGFLVGAAVALSGCPRAGSSVYGETNEPISLSIKTTPADDDPYAIRIARHLAEHLEAVGIETEILPLATRELLRSVLVTNDFDIYVARHAGAQDPDFLRPFAHSRFDTQPGWYNPFGLADIDIDELLERQRYEHSQRRRSTIQNLQWELARLQPFTVIGRPDTVHAVRTDRVRDWPTNGIQAPGDLLDVTPRSDVSLDELRIATLDDRATINRNPIAFEFRNRGLVMGLLYEPLARWVDGDLQPRLARDWSWEDSNEQTIVTVRLRSAKWHDGSTVTASDVAFTYRFLADTSLGEGSVPIPAPRFRGRTSIVEDVRIIDDTTVQLRIDASQEVARRVFTLPMLPESEWKPRARETDIAEFPLQDGVTEALAWQNPTPIGSGPLAFERAAVQEALVLRRFENHFDDSVPYDRLSFRVVPSGKAAIELVIADEVDATGPVAASLVPDIARSGAASLLTGSTPSFYHVGYNTRNEPLNNPQFRLAVAALLDRNRVLTDIFEGFASIAASPLHDEWLAPGLEANETDPIAPFPGEDGELDVQAARAAFSEAGYQVRDDGRIVQ